MRKLSVRAHTLWEIVFPVELMLEVRVVASMQIRPEVSYDLDVSQVARYIIALDSQRPEPDVTQLKLQKLLYLVQANYLAATGRRLFDAPVEAFDNGPVVYSVLKQFESYSRLVIAPDSTSWEPELLPIDARVFVDAVWHRYHDWTASALWRLTHLKKSPWDQYYEKDSFRRQIPDVAMRDYFRTKVAYDQRVVHPDVVVADQEFLDDLDSNEDEIVSRAVKALR